MYPGHADDVRIADFGGLAPTVRGHRRRAPAQRGCGGARQDQHGRVRHGELDGELRVRPDTEPAPPRQGARRQQRRVRRGRGRRVRPARARVGHGRVHPPARCAVRRGRHEAHVRARVALWAGRLRQLARPDRPVRDDGAGRRAPLRRPGRTRRSRQHLVALGTRDDIADGGRRRRGCPRRAVP